MPCYDPRDADDARREIAEAKLTKALLCAVIRVGIKTYGYAFIDDIYARWDKKACGLPYSAFVKWWDDHQKEDNKRG